MAIPTSGTEQAVKVATYGLDNRSKKMLALTFDKCYRGLIELVDSDDAADALLIDLDCEDADALLKNHLHAKKPVIVMSIRHASIEDTVYIRKPVNIPVLLEAVRELILGVSSEEINKKLPSPLKPIAAKSVKIGTKPQAKKPASNIKATAKNIKTTANALNERVEDNTLAALVMKRSGVSNFAGLYYKQNDYALGCLLRAAELARSQSACVKLICWNKYFIVFNPVRNEEILTNLSDGLIRSLGVVRTTGEELCIESNVMTAEEFSALLKDNAGSMKLFSAQAFIWKLTLLTARGRVPEGIDLMQPVFLQHWPNMTRLEPVPHGLRIAALWSVQPRSLLSMFAVLGIPFDHILNLYSAANAIGLAGQANRKPDALIDPDEPKEHHHRGLFSSLLHKLSGRKAK